MQMLWQSATSFQRIGSVTNLVNFLTTNLPMNHAECHLQHALSSTRRNTFTRNVVNLLDIVLEWQTPYSVTVNVVVPQHNSHVDTVVDACLFVCLENCDRVYRSYGQERLVEKTKNMSITISTLKLYGFTDNPQ